MAGASASLRRCMRTLYAHRGVVIAFLVTYTLATSVVLLLQARVLVVAPTTAPPSVVSKFLCVGETFQEDAWKYRSCHLQSVCYDGNAAGVFTFHVDPGRPGRSAPAPGQLAVSASPLGCTHPAVRWEPVVVHAPVEDDVDWAEDIPHVLAVEYNGSNFGHVLGDSVLPWWRLLDMFGFGHDEFQPVHMEVDPLFKYSCAWQVREKWIRDASICDELYRKVAVPFAKRGLLSLQQHYNRTGRRRRVCFRNLFAGIGMLSDHGHDHTVHGRYAEHADLHMVGGGPMVWGFRDEYMRRLGLDSNAQPLPGANDVVFVARTSQHRAWYDAERAQAYLENEFRDRGVQVRRPLEFNTLPMKLQVELVSTARVLVTFPGGSSYIAMFLPRGSTLIFVFSHESDGRQDYPLWGNLAHVNVVWIEGNYSSSSREVVFDHAQLSRAVETALLYQ